MNFIHFFARSVGRGLLVATRHEAQQVKLARRAMASSNSTVSDKFKVGNYHIMYVHVTMSKLSFTLACNAVGRH